MAVRYLENVAAQSICNARNPQCVLICCGCKTVLLAQPLQLCNCPAEGVSDTAAAALYKKKKTPPVPSGRYGASCVAYNDKLWMFAGTDGGYSKHGNGGYELGDVCVVDVLLQCVIHSAVMSYMPCSCSSVPSQLEYMQATAPRLTASI